MSFTPSERPASGPDSAFGTRTSGRSRNAFNRSRMAVIVQHPDTVAAALFDARFFSTGDANLIEGHQLRLRTLEALVALTCPLRWRQAMSGACLAMSGREWLALAAESPEVRTISPRQLWDRRCLLPVRSFAFSQAHRICRPDICSCLAVRGHPGLCASRRCPCRAPRNPARRTVRHTDTDALRHL